MVPRHLVACVFIAAATAALAQGPPGDGHPDRLGPQVGEVVPDFEAPDQHGVLRRLSSLLGPKGAMLVFYRSADW